MISYFFEQCVNCECVFEQGSIAHHYLVGTRYLSMGEAQILSMRHVVSLCNDCLWGFCPGESFLEELVADLAMSKTLLPQRSSFPEHTYSGSSCSTCQGQIYDLLPFYTIEHIKEGSVCAVGTQRYPESDFSDPVSCLLALCPICGAQIDVFDLALECFEILDECSAVNFQKYEGDYLH